MLLAALGGAREGEPASREQVERVHDGGYLDGLASLEHETWVDGDTIAGPSSYEAALLAAGCAVAAVETRGFALVRPPGHHALPDRQPDWRAGAAAADALGLGRLAGRLEEAASS